jgi:predicted porin
LAATASFAQSTVTLFGGADINYRNVSSGVNKFSGLAQDGIYSSRFGVNGTEDLGGGLKANFHFEGGMNADVGTAAGFNFARKSTIGLAGGFGEVRMGRDYTPLFTVHGIADPFGTNGVGSYLNIAGSTVVSDGTAIGAQDAQDLTGTFTTVDRGTERRTDASGLRAGARTDARITVADPSAVRMNNSVAYYTPAFNGFSAALMYSFGAENAYNLKTVGKGTSLKLAYANGPINVAYANQVTKGGLTAAAASVAVTSGTATVNGTDVTATNGTDDQKWTTDLLAAAYDLGVAKVSYMYRKDSLKVGGVSDLNATYNTFGVSAPVGATTLKASYTTKKVGTTVGSYSIDTKAGNQFAVGAVYDLSKRTSVYATYAVLKNEAGFANNVGVAANGGNSSKGFETGLKHSF